MTSKSHRLGVSESSLVVRRLKLEPTDSGAMTKVVAEIDEIYGLDAVSFDEKSHRLTLAYDATRVCLDCFEGVLEKYQVEISHDWWTRTKEDFYRFFDQNIKDNMNSPAMGCHGGVSGRSAKK